MRRNFPRRNAERFGCKDGAGPTRGKSAKTYAVSMPDGSCVQKRSFDVDMQEGLASVYCHDGKWYCAAVFPADAVPAWAQPRESNTKQLAKAERLT